MIGTMTMALFSRNEQVEAVVYCRPISSAAMHRKYTPPKSRDAWITRGSFRMSAMTLRENSTKRMRNASRKRVPRRFRGSKLPRRCFENRKEEPRAMLRAAMSRQPVRKLIVRF